MRDYVGIDLGTTNCAICSFNGEEVAHAPLGAPQGRRSRRVASKQSLASPRRSRALRAMTGVRT